MKQILRRFENKKVLISLALAFVLLIAPHVASAAAIDIPCRPSTQGTADLYVCVNQIYKYALVLTSIAAVFMIMFAGYLYIFSGGNEKRVSAAKGFITTSLVGIAMLLVGFLLLKQINPSLLTIKSITPTQINQQNWFDGNSGITLGTDDAGGIGGLGPSGGGQTGGVQGNGVTCNGGRDTRRDSAKCGCYESEVNAAAQEFGVDKNLIKAIIQQESQCNPNAGSGAGARGLMQLISSTAGGLGCASNWATDPKENIRCGTKYLKRIMAVQGSSGLRYVLASYNAGEGPRAQGPSSFCSGMRKWECPFNNADHSVCNTGYEETRNYVISAERFYNEYKGGKCGN